MAIGHLADPDSAPFLYQTDIGIKRDTASVAYRWTPTDAWDIKADYSHLARTGTQIDGVVGFGNAGGGGSSAIQVPRPVDDTTQNYGLNGEYAGTSPWGKKFTVKVAYNGSQYTDNFSSYTIQNPFTTRRRPARAPLQSIGCRCGPATKCQCLQRDGGRRSAVEEPLCRHGQLHDDAAERCVHSDDEQSGPAPGVNILPASSLNGAINTLLSNNVVTTKITPELTNKLSYRYYNFDNQTPELLFPTWTSLDRTELPDKVRRYDPKLVDLLHQAKRRRRVGVAADARMDARRRLRLRAIYLVARVCRRHQ